MDNMMRMVSEEFENMATEEKITGITVMIDGKLKQVFDVIIKNSSKEMNYTELLHEIIIRGIDSYIKGKR